MKSGLPGRFLDSAWHVNITADGRLIVAAFGDGTIRWSRVSDGQEVLALFNNLKELFKPNTTGVPDVGLGAVAWSEDGRFLFAGGFWVVQNVMSGTSLER